MPCVSALLDTRFGPVFHVASRESWILITYLEEKVSIGIDSFFTVQIKTTGIKKKKSDCRYKLNAFSCNFSR